MLPPLPSDEQAARPSGAKARILSALNGTAEAVPYPRPFMRPVVVFSSNDYRC